MANASFYSVKLKPELKRRAEAEKVLEHRGQPHVKVMSIKDLFSENHLVIQQGRSNCGPASLLNVLHLNDDFSRTEEELAQLCGTREGYGTTTANMVKATQQLAQLELVEEKSQGTIEDIERNIDLGAFVIILYSNAYSGNSHYTCVTEYDDRAIFCRDSAFGFLRFSKEYLEKSWHGNSRDASQNSQQWYMAVKYVGAE